METGDPIVRGMEWRVMRNERDIAGLRKELLGKIDNLERNIAALQRTIYMSIGGLIAVQAVIGLGLTLWQILGD